MSKERWLLDSNIIIDIVLGDQQNDLSFINNKELAISKHTVGELLAGIYLFKYSDEQQNLLLQLFGILNILPIDDSVLHCYAVLVAKDTKKARDNYNDIWIEATAMAHNCELYTGNPSDFIQFDNSILEMTTSDTSAYIETTPQ